VSHSQAEASYLSSLATEEEKAEEERQRKEQFRLDVINAAAERERRANRKGVVEVLELARCGVCGDGLAALVSGLADEHCSLRTLSLAGNGLGGEEGCLAMVEAIENNSTLESLDLRGCKLSAPTRYPSRALFFLRVF
jgi:hypothetical protein